MPASRRFTATPVEAGGRRRRWRFWVSTAGGGRWAAEMVPATAPATTAYRRKRRSSASPPGMPEAARFGAAVRYPFREQGWAGKAGILALLSFIPVLNIAAVGYEVEIARRVAEGGGSARP